MPAPERTPEEIRDVLLESARQAGPRYINVRGVDLLAALTLERPAERTRRQSPDRSEESNES